MVRISQLLVSTAIPLAMITAAPAAGQTGDAVVSDTTAPAEDMAVADGDDFHGPSDDLVVTAPFVRSLDLFGNVGVVQGDDLARDMRGQVGDLLARQPGVSATSFSPGASRPVLRGFQGERVRVLTDGLGSLDASNTSADHAVAIDPLTAERIEIVRGPASLLFGSSASGGAVNIFDRRIPRAVPEAPLHLDAIGGYGSAADQWTGGASVDVALTNDIVWHVDGNYSRSDDLRIGGYQLAPALRSEVLALSAEELGEGHADEAAELAAAANERSRLPNSATETWSAGTGLALITDGGSLGVSIGYLDSRYGVPGRPGAGHHHEEMTEGGPAAVAEEDADVTIGLTQWRADLRGEVALGSGLFETLRVRAGFADYQHTEFEGSETGTIFLNQGLEGRMELVQADRNGWRGASGIQYYYRDFNAIGAEAFVPQNDTEQFALFSLQELAFGPVSVEVAGRYEQTSVTANALTVAREFDAWSGALGLAYSFGNNSKVGVNFARTARAPSAEELFSNGPHIATQSYEIGDPNFAVERSWSAEAFLKLRTDAINISVTGFANWFDNFIYATNTGAELDDLPVFQYRQGDARYFGAELEADVPIAQFGGYALNANLVGDLVRAKLGNGGGDVPRIPPMRVRGGLELRSETLAFAGEIEWSDAQTRVAAFETPTDGFTMVNASVDWKPLGRNGGMTMILAANNIFDVVGRRHASFTKDFVPLSGRDIRLTLRLSF